MLKVNLISNLILSVLREDLSTAENIESVLKAAVSCPHRLALIQKSQEFKQERQRLRRILEDSHKLGFKGVGQVESLLTQFLSAGETLTGTTANLN